MTLSDYFNKSLVNYIANPLFLQAVLTNSRFFFKVTEQNSKYIPLLFSK